MIRTIALTFWFIVTLVLRIPSWVSFLSGCVIVSASGLNMLINHQGFALRLTTYSFGLFTIGLITYIRELKNYERK